MEQLNNVLPNTLEDNKPAAAAVFERKPESPLLDEVRRKFGIYGGISLIFGMVFTLLFYKAGIGVNIFLFTLVMITLLCTVRQRLSVPVKKGTKYYYVGAALLGLSTALSSSETLWFLNIIGILLLLDLSLLHQFYEDRKWEFLKHFFRMIGLVFQSAAAVGMPFIDCINYMKHTRVFKNDRVRNIAIGILISIPFLWVIMALLSNADLLFGKLTKNIFNLIFSTDIFAVVFLIFIGFLICYCIICAAVTRTKLEEEKAFKKADASIAAAFMTMLSLVYAVFCGIQVTFLFAGGLFVLPESLTYAEYARKGFFELLAVAVINVVLMVLCRSLFQENKLLKFDITFMTLCTYIMIVSASYRMLLYISAYHLTFLRVIVLLSLFIIAMILAGVIISQYRQTFPLFRYCVVIVSVCYIAFSFSKPDYYIASYLIDHTALLKEEDVRYLTQELSLDASPKVLKVLADDSRLTPGLLAYREKYYSRIEKAKPDLDFRAINYANYTASQNLKQYPLK